MSRKFDIAVLKTFHAVARFGRFKEAARYVNRSASAVTVQIRKLEEQVGYRLFHRNNNVVELTPFGRRLLGYTTDFLVAHDRLITSLSPQFLLPKLRLGVPDTYVAKLMSDLLPAFTLNNPMLELEVEARSSGELFDLFSQQMLDITLLVASQCPQNGEFLCTTSPRWIASRTFKYDPDQPLPISVHLHGCPYREATIRALKTAGIKFRIFLESSSPTAVEASVMSGLAIGVMEDGLIGKQVAKSVQGIELPDLAEHSICLLTSTANPAAVCLRKAIYEHFTKIGFCLA
ncbi:LysR family transcriptional regulator [Pseudomonas chlororaphis]|uniref:LysR family transcriptional regulator n=1 Tax=Pseudomonas chlororaphis TaxID=587753 RepID=UPI00087D3FFA|nr:LysR family transcriptional regulator [Pseudomonas chlororaphis]AZC31813.1 putative transcriptional regulator lrhA [Pseudomonas chlororaphis subsp. piscium]MBP5072420.1 LysR family transcriptional regulator [Pseudomonas chlororaphis]QTT88397.1 LysR family transcriptional regulator [Pseudomonas chlororaphis]WDG77649.1 LysR family transcriptional regulator [Pseudomonas chlororaphis]WDG83114.1 LysR family transcriptional regulator [Pseudomonas chlororaphis]